VKRFLFAAPVRPLNFTVGCKVRNLRLPTFLLFAWLVAESVAPRAETPKADTPSLSVQEVSAIADRAFKESMSHVEHYDAEKPEFRPGDHLWLVLYRQNGPPYIPDGNMMVIVNDRTRKACVQQTMLPPRPCT
jgi:hypothetical protein